MLTLFARTLPFQRLALATLTTAAFAPAMYADDSKKVATEIIQEAVQQPTAVHYGASIATRYKVGAKIKSKGGAVQNILIMVAVPLTCGEQDVQVVQEDFSPHIEGVEFRQLPDDKRAEPGAQQMLITISELPPRQEAYALITYEVVTKAILPPEETASLTAPAKPDRTIKPYLSASPFINVNHRKIREAVKDALAAPKEEAKTQATADAGGQTADASPGDDSSAYEEVDAANGEQAKEPATTGAAESAPEQGELAGVDEAATFQTGPPSEVDADAAADKAAASGDWQRVEALYDYVIEHVKYEDGAQDKSSLQALQDGKADCHGISALFVAMCRTAKVPARMVWVDEHQYAEFYLEDEAGKGHWYPVQSAGTRSFGEMPTPKVILQKGDNFRVPERRRERLRYASDFTILLSLEKYKPTVTYIREQL